MSLLKRKYAGEVTALGRTREPYRIYRDPVPVARHGRKSRYPFDRMKAGDCFYVPLTEIKSPNVVVAAARQWAKRNSKDWKFVTRAVGNQVGVWRVA